MPFPESKSTGLYLPARFTERVWVRSHAEPIAYGGSKGARAGKNLPWCTLPGLLANFWQNGFRMEIPERGSEKSHVFTVILWWAWVDLNHRPRPYQGALGRASRSCLAVRLRPNALYCPSSGTGVSRSHFSARSSFAIRQR